MAQLSQANKEYLLSLKPEDLTFRTLVSILGDTTSNKNGFSSGVKKSRMNPTDTFELNPSEYFVKEKTLTTVGRFIFNKYIVERCKFQSILGYVNIPLTAKAVSKLEVKLSSALTDNRITNEDFKKYIDYRDTLGLQLHSVIATSFTMNTIKTPPAVAKKKAELFRKYKKELDSGDIALSEKIEKELVSDAKAILKGDPGLDLYNSEARGNFGNYKNMNIYKGATLNGNSGKYEIVQSSFMDGIRKEDIPSFGSAVIAGAYPKAVGTADSGYLSKQLMAAMQSEVLDKHGSDCKTHKTIDMVLEEGDKQLFLYRYIVVNGKYVCLTPEVIDKYVGKLIHLRSVMYCTNKKSCNICAGEMSYMLDTLNVGLGCSKVATRLLEMGMKKFHISTLKSTSIDVDTMLI